MSLQSGSSSSEKLRSEQNWNWYVEDALYAESSSISEQLLTTWLDSTLGSSSIGVSGAEMATTIRTTDLALTVSIDAVNCCLVCLSRTQAISKCVLIANDDAFIHNWNENLCENHLASRSNTGTSRPTKKLETQKRITFDSRHRKYRIASRFTPPTTRHFEKVLLSGPPSNLSFLATAKRFTSAKSGETGMSILEKYPPSSLGACAFVDDDSSNWLSKQGRNWLSVLFAATEWLSSP